MSKQTIILTDQNNMERAHDRGTEIQKGGGNCVILCLEEENDLEKKLSLQPLGAQIVIFAETAFIQNLRQLALRVGFKQRDINVIPREEGPMSAFCSQCHHIQSLTKKEFACENCHQTIEASDHFSAYHQAYLAYPVFTQKR
ncbi:hypothetical protein ACSVDE_03935 [Pseudalkalibacillus sp. Hm43]|uniref:hypothetical protein n=1 Tax=Pseudalkalibacillus sp. Hm43 TaxID=3450742 RepID=UPI003F441838